MSDNGYTVMVSTHKEMIDALEQIEAPYTVVIPRRTDYEIYCNRYTLRGNTPEFISKVLDKWEDWISYIIDTPSVLKTVVMLPKDGCIQAWAKTWTEV